MGENHLDTTDYQQLAEIMTGPHGQPVSPESSVDLLVVFSCADPLVGQTAAALHSQKLVQQVVFSGGVGKDSGGLPRLGISEAVFLTSVAIAGGLPAEVIVLEQDARNGKENAAFSLRLTTDQGLLRAGMRVASLAPAPRSRRLYEELRYQADVGGYNVEVAAGFSSGTAEASNPQVQAELIRELRGLRTMHAGDAPRIFPQDEFQPGGTYHDLVKLAGIAE